MEQVERLEQVENKGIGLLDNIKDIVNLLSEELKQEDHKAEILQKLDTAASDIQNIGRELHEIIESLEYP